MHRLWRYFQAVMIGYIVWGVCACGESSSFFGEKEKKSTSPPLFSPPIFENMDRRTKLRTQSYLIQGYELYRTHCVSCHTKEGKALRKLIPSLQYSPFSAQEIACMIRFGKKEQKDSLFQPPMPIFPALKDIEIAEITTFVQNAWGRTHGLVGVKEVSKYLRDCPSPPFNESP